MPNCIIWLNIGDTHVYLPAMRQEKIKQIIERRALKDGLLDTNIPGVKLFRATQSIPCAPAVYEPCIIAITSGTKEAVLDGTRYEYDSTRSMCCPLSMPVKAGTPDASPERPLYGVYISLNARVMNELAMVLENSGGAIPRPSTRTEAQAIKLARWDEGFSDALLRLLELGDSEADIAVLGETRLREVYYAVLKGEAGFFARQAFSMGNAITRSISHVSTHLDAPISIYDLAQRAGMSRAVFHRKFKQATTMSPIQFVKSLRLNNAATQIAEGKTVSEAAMNVGYVSTSQFSREFKRIYGHSPKQWSDAHHPSLAAV